MSVKKAEIVQQLKYMEGYPDTWRETMEDKLNAQPNIKSWVYIVHDKDVDEEGNPKEAHFHLVVETLQSVQFSTIGGYIDVPKQYVERIKQGVKSGRYWRSDIGGAYSYLTHRNAPDKYQYSDDEVVAKDGFDWKQIRDKSEMTKQEIQALHKTLKDIENGKIRRFNLFKVVSMEQYISYKKDFEKAFEYREGVLRNNPERKIEVIYIYGQPGAGKSVLARNFAKNKNLSYFVSGSTKDPLQGYEGQSVLILDDLRSNNFALSDLLKLLDNNVNSQSASRYRDKWLEVEYIIITTVQPIREFFNSYYQLSEPVDQLMRRCKTMIELTRAEIKMYTYKKGLCDYVLVSSAENPITKAFKAEDVDLNQNELTSMCAGFGLTYAPTKTKAGA